MSEPVCSSRLGLGNENETTGWRSRRSVYRNRAASHRGVANSDT